MPGEKMDNLISLETQLLEFLNFKRKLQSSNLQLEFYNDYAIIIGPQSESSESIGKDIDLCFVGLTHGDEVIGLSVINEILHLIYNKRIELRERVAFVLANTTAALRQKRYLERDLNRAFCVDKPLLKEEVIAKKLEPLFARCKFILDIHQTIQPSASPFFIFEYFDKRQIQLFNLLDNTLPAILSLETFSEEGLGIEEYVKSLGGITLTVELGKLGFHEEQKAKGISIAINVLNAVRKMNSEPATIDLRKLANRIYTWGHVGRYNDGEAKLDSGWVNMSSVAFGQRIGTNADEIITAPCSGKIIFPKYNSQTNEVVDLFRIVVELSVEKLKIYE